MIVLGIDPGTRHLGWGVVQTRGTRITYLAHGVVSTTVGVALEQRLLELDDALALMIAEVGPAHAAVESIFFAKDAQAAGKLGHARGVVLLRLARAGLAVAEYAPAQIKRAVTGSGRADKRQVAQMIATVLGLASAPPTDAADALAVAVTHARTLGLPALLRG